MFQCNYIFNMFQSTDIPFNQFQKLGKSKHDILGLTTTELKALLSGRITSLLEIKPEGGKVSNAKLSIYRLEDGSIDIKVHPVRDEVQLPTNFDKQQTEQLLKGDSLTASNNSKVGVKEEYMYKVDLETNEVYKTPITNIHIADTIQGNAISKEQKQQLLEGKSITLINNKSSFQLQIDLASQKGYKIHNQHGVKQDLKSSVQAGVAGKSTGIELEQSIKQGRKR